MKILEQKLFLDTEGVFKGASLITAERDKIMPEARAGYEDLIQTWRFPAQYGPTGTQAINCPFGVRVEPETPAVTGPVLGAPAPWEATGAYWPSVLYDPEDGLYKMWYEVFAPCSRLQWIGEGPEPFTEAAQDGKMLLTGYAHSRDGLHWERPQLDFYLYDGQKTNLLEGWHNEGAVFLDERHRENGKFKSFALRVSSDPAIPPAERANMEVIASDDGIHWRKAEGAEPLHYFFDTQNVLQYDEQLGKYVTYMRGHYNGRSISRGECDALARLPMPQPLLYPDNMDPPDVDYYNNAFTCYPYDKSIRLLFPTMFAHSTDLTWIRMAVSHNGRNFQWVSRQPVIGPALPGVAEGGIMFANPAMLPMGQQVGMLMEFGSVRHEEHRVLELYEGGMEGRSPQIYLMLWEKDRLAGLVADGVGQVCCGVRICGKHPRLQLNLRARGQGRVWLEVRSSQYGRPLEGYSFADGRGIGGNAAWQDYCWQGGADLAALDGQDVMLCIRIENAKLFGWRLAAEEA